MMDQGAINLLFIASYPLTDDFCEKFHLSHLGKEGFRITYISLEEIIGSAIGQPALASKINTPVIYTPHSLKDFLSYIRKFDSNTVRIIYQTRITDLKLLFIYYKLSAARFPMFFFERSIPVLVSRDNKKIYGWAKFSGLFGKGGLGLVKRYVPARIFSLFIRAGILKKYDIVFFDSEIAREIAFGYGQELVKINHFDIEKLNTEIKNFSTKAQKIKIVFLDDNLVGDDFKVINLKFDREKYLNQLNRFIIACDQIPDCDFVFCAHPKSNYTAYEIKAKNIVKKRTHEMMADADLIFTHYSTSVSTAVYLNKKIVLLDSDIFVMNFKFIKDYIYSLRDLLDLPVFDLNGTLSPSEFNNLLAKEVNSIAYKRYVRKFLGSYDSSRSNSSVEANEYAHIFRAV